MENGVTVENVRVGNNTAALSATDPTTVMDGVEIVLQPIIDLATGGVSAVEALARFAHAPTVPVEDVFAQAHAQGFGSALETACLRAALRRRADLPGGVKLSVNVSPDVVHHPSIAKCWTGDLDGVIIEVTERAASSPAALRDQLSWLRLRGAEIAVDDVSTGYAGLLRLASMRPDLVKIDHSVVAGVRDSVAQTAVLEALVTFSHRIGASVIGEGVETLDDLAAISDFDVDFGQGFALGRPGPMLGPVNSRVVAACQQNRERVLQRDSVGQLGMYAVTSVVSNARCVAELHAAVSQAAAELGIDVIGVSVCDEDNQLREITSSGDAIDPRCYPLADYPATQHALTTRNTVEVHVDDPNADAGEKLILERLGRASLLMIPLVVDDQAVGVVEFSHRTHRRWTSYDIAHGRGLATHLGRAFLHIRDWAPRS